MCAGLGFLIACSSVLLSFIAPPEVLRSATQEPAVQFAFITCPILDLHYLPLQFWWIPLIIAATYGSAYLPFELLGRRAHSGLIINSRR